MYPGTPVPRYLSLYTGRHVIVLPVPCSLPGCLLHRQEARAGSPVSFTQQVHTYAHTQMVVGRRMAEFGAVVLVAGDLP